MKKKIIAMLLAIITAFSVVVVPVNAAAENKKKIDVVNIWEDGYPMFNIGSFLETIFFINEQMNTIAGFKIFNEEKIVITTDELLSGVVEKILETSGVDFSLIYKNFPHSQYAEVVTSTLKINIPEAQAMLNDLSNKAYAENDVVTGTLLRLVSIWLGIVDEVQILTKPADGKPGLYEVGIEITYRDGRKEYMYSGIFYDANTNAFVGRDGKPALFGYYMNLDDNVVYTGIDVWQREMGFNMFYDIFCYLTPFFFHYTTQRIKFDYDGREWMFQLWKGRYAIANGGEVGIYTRDAGSIGSFYDCGSNEDMLVMSMDVYHGDDLLFSRPAELHWWVTGFQVSDTAYLPHSLTIVATISLRDQAMLDAVLGALKSKKGIIDYEVNGLNLTLTW